MSSTDIFGQLAAQDQARQQHDQAIATQNKGDIFSQIAANGGTVPQPQAPDTSGQSTNAEGNTIIVPKDGESFEDTMKRAVEHGKTLMDDNGGLNAEGQKEVAAESKAMPGKVATTLAAAPVIGAAGAATLAGAGQVGGALADELPYIRSSPRLYAEYVKSKVGEIPGLLKSAWDWVQANPVKAYVLYKVLDEAGIGPSGVKKVLHIASGAGE